MPKGFSGFKGKKHSQAWKDNKSKQSKGNTYATALKGIPFTAEHKQKLSESALKRVKEGRHNSWKGGKPFCLDCGKQLVAYTAKRCKPCRAAQDLSGENHWAWKGGITSEYKRIRATNEYKIWRKTILKRDNFTCVLCGDRNFIGRGQTVVLQADHIKPFYLYPDLRFELSNGRTLCISCHRKTETWGRPTKHSTE